MLIICSECGKEYSNQAKNCPHCGAISSQNRYVSSNLNVKNSNINGTNGSGFSALLAIILILALGFIGYKLFFGALGELGIEKEDIVSTFKDAWEHDNKKSSTKSSYEYTKIYNIGDKITTDKFEITITNIETRTTVGGTIFKETAHEDSIFLCYTVKIKNISSESIGTFSQPTIKLVDNKNITYGSDISASSYYATEINTNNNTFSDLNPGVTVIDAAVFELGKSYYMQNNFNLKICADKTVLVKIK